MPRHNQHEVTATWWITQFEQANLPDGAAVQNAKQLMQLLLDGTSFNDAIQAIREKLRASENPEIVQYSKTLHTAVRLMWPAFLATIPNHGFPDKVTEPPGSTSLMPTLNAIKFVIDEKMNLRNAAIKANVPSHVLVRAGIRMPGDNKQAVKDHAKTVGHDTVKRRPDITAEPQKTTPGRPRKVPTLAGQGMRTSENDQ
jgi:hypothetical protein